MLLVVIDITSFYCSAWWPLPGGAILSMRIDRSTAVTPPDWYGEKAITAVGATPKSGVLTRVFPLTWHSLRKKFRYAGLTQNMDGLRV